MVHDQSTDDWSRISLLPMSKVIRLKIHRLKVYSRLSTPRKTLPILNSLREAAASIRDFTNEAGTPFFSGMVKPLFYITWFDRQRTWAR